MKNSQVACLVGAMISLFVWLPILSSFGVAGRPLTIGVTIAFAGGLWFGGAIFSSYTKNSPQWRDLIASVVVLSVPILFCWFSGKPTGTEQQVATPPVAQTPTDGRSAGVDGTVPKVREMAKKAKQTGKEEALTEAIASGEVIRPEDAYRQPTPQQVREQPNPCIRRLDKYNTVITFTVPGCFPIIDADLMANPGAAYFVNTNGKINGIRVATLKNGSDPDIKKVLPEHLNREEGFPLWGNERSQGRTLGFIIDAVPNGSYQINIRQSHFSLRIGETSPGEFTKRPIVW